MLYYASHGTTTAVLFCWHYQHKLVMFHGLMMLPQLAKSGIYMQEDNWTEAAEYQIGYNLKLIQKGLVHFLLQKV